MQIAGRDLPLQELCHTIHNKNTNPHLESLDFTVYIRGLRQKLAADVKEQLWMSH